jgi:hypothetical protein
MNGFGALRLKTRNATGAFSVEKLAVFGGRPVVGLSQIFSA